MGLNRIHSMGEYDPDLLFFTLANILMQSAPWKQSKEAMKCAGFKQFYIKYDKYQNCIETLKIK